MVKRYRRLYKKMQKQRFYATTFIFFYTWLEYKCSHFIHKFALFFLRPLFIKLKFFRKFRRRFRKILRRRHLFLMFFCTPNFLIHEKPTNARMGKGKGNPGHWVCKTELHRPFAILGGIAQQRLLRIFRYFQKYLHPYMYWRALQFTV